MIFFIRYWPDDGEISGWGFGFEPDPIEGMAIAYVAPFDTPPDPSAQKFNGVDVIDKTPDEIRRSRLPMSIEVQQAIWMELHRTDQFMVTDRHVAARDAWADYRQMLRDLSKLAGPVDMVNAWDVPPDGTDPISALRARL